MRHLAMLAARSGACILAAACGSNSRGSFLQDGVGTESSDAGASRTGSAGAAGGGSSSSGGLFGGTGSSGGASGSSGGAVDTGNGCTGNATNFVYVLSAQNDMYRFAPGNKVFTKIGRLGCPTTMQPNSMAVDRNAVAWVNYVQTDPVSGVDSAGVIYRVSTTDATCQSTPTIDLQNGWYRIGMGFATTTNANGTTGGSVAETLYVAGVGGVAGTGLGSIDFTTNTVKPIGMFTGSLAGRDAELTGTGDGRLYGFFTTIPVEVAQIDPSTGATPLAVQMSGVQTPNDWAFSFWGGHFYLYTSLGLPAGVGAGSDVTDYDPASGVVNPSYMTSIGFDIVGAGVSTCAPVRIQ